ncbi:MAG: sulfur carrier protein ThiS [Campylobacterales bacterium]
MRIVVNGEELEVKEGITIGELLRQLKVLEQTVAIAVNSEIVKRDQWESYRLKEGDKVEALQFVGGG